MSNAVLVEGLTKSYGTTQALAGIDLAIPQGTVLGLLGPNGAGKTTAVRILTTLLVPDAGRAEVLGMDVVRDAARLRTVIGLAGQYAAIDELLTGRENLRLVGRLYHLGRSRSTQRADELLERFDLVDAAERPARTYSGGMRRRLDLAASLVNKPQVLFLDEPTTGLDPRSRLDVWEMILNLVREGTTVLLTTQYLEEADRLADRIAVIDGGQVIAEGTSDELKTRLGGEVLELRVGDPTQLEGAARALASLGQGEPQCGDASGTLTLPATGGVALVSQAAHALESSGVTVTELALRRPTLDDVFLTLTGRAAQITAEEPTPPADSKGRRAARSAA
jgi:ABC-2 type transport system ATP-binding protein